MEAAKFEPENRDWDSTWLDWTNQGILGLVAISDPYSLNLLPFIGFLLSKLMMLFQRILIGFELNRLQSIPTIKSGAQRAEMPWNRQ
jgi:hypothetical protein